MLLGGHPLISSLGEVHRLSLAAIREDGPFRCTCGESVRACPFWQGVLAKLQEMEGTDDAGLFQKMATTNPAFLSWKSAEGDTLDEPEKKRFYPLELNCFLLLIGSSALWSVVGTFSREVGLNRTFVSNSLKVFEAVRRAWGTPIVVDSTKNPARMKGLYLMDKARFRALYLIRDGRAVTNSRMRRMGMPMEYCARCWIWEHRKQRLALLTVPKDRVWWMKYEDLCRNPERELSRVCAQLGIEFHPQMLDLSRPRHNIGGNPMRFRSSGTGIELDERWKNELSAEDLRVFERIAGPLNRRFGYLD